SPLLGTLLCGLRVGKTHRDIVALGKFTPDKDFAQAFESSGPGPGTNLPGIPRGSPGKADRCRTMSSSLCIYGVNRYRLSVCHPSRLRLGWKAISQRDRA